MKGVEWIKAQDELERIQSVDVIVTKVLLKSLLWPWLYTLEPKPRQNFEERDAILLISSCLDFQETLAMNATSRCWSGGGADQRILSNTPHCSQQQRHEKLYVL